MPIVADAAVAVRGDLSGFKKDLAGAEKQTQTLGQKLKGALTPGNVLTGLGIGAGLAGVSQLLSGAINDASDLAESMGKVEVVFGDGSEAVEAWAETAATAFGQSKQSALEAAGTYGNLFQAFGIGREQAQEMSTTLVELAADLASFNNTSVEDALLALRSGLSGETEPLKRYGVALSDVRLKEEALRLGLIETATGTLPVAVKAQASYSLILKDTALAQGDFARTSDGLANQQRILSARLEDVSAEMGEKLLPVVLDLVTFVNDHGIPALKEFIDLLDFGDADSAEGIAGLEQVEDVINSIADAGPRLNDHITGNFGRISDAAAELGIDYEEMRERVRAVLDQVGGDHERAIERVLAADKAWEQAKGWEEYQNAIRGGADDIDAAAADMADGIPQAMEDAEAEGMEVARRTPGSLAGELREGIDDYDAALEELTVVAENSVSDLAERQKIEGILASQELTDALNSDSTRTRLLAMELVGDLVSDYELLAPGALEAGELVNPALRDGIYSNLDIATEAGEAIVDAADNPLVDTSWAFDSGYNIATEYARGMRVGKGIAVDAAGELAQGVASQVAINSEPEAHDSPLRGITKWGGNIVKTIADGIYDQLGTGAGAAGALAGALVPSFATPGVPMSHAEMTPVSAKTYVLQVEGEKKVVGTRADVLDAWESLERLG